jgi:peptide/nickel transport system permease protein
MARYIARRIMVLIPLLFVMSIITFTLIQLPPSDFLTMKILELKAAGTEISEEQIAAAPFV